VHAAHPDPDPPAHLCYWLEEDLSNEDPQPGTLVACRICGRTWQYTPGSRAPDCPPGWLPL
jgi:hypothetical protein